MYKNIYKLIRAKAAVGPDATEEQIKAEYLKLGGLYIDEETTPEPAPKVTKNKK